MKYFDKNETNFAPVVESDDDQSCYERFLNKNSGATKVASTPVASPERDTLFQRAMSAVVGFLKPDNQLAPFNRNTAIAPDCSPASNLHLPVCDIAIQGKWQLRTLHHLLHTTRADGIPAKVLQQLSGSHKEWDTVFWINQNVGQVIVKSAEHLATTKTGKAVRRSNYWLTPEGKCIAVQILANSRYMHDENPQGRHPRPVVATFLDSTELTHEDLLVLRDSTKPQWLRLLYLLRAVNGQWVPRYLADELLGARNIREVVRIVNIKKLHGPAIESMMKAAKNRDGASSKYGLYRITDDWLEAADQLLKSSFKVSM